MYKMWSVYRNPFNTLKLAIWVFIMFAGNATAVNFGPTDQEMVRNRLLDLHNSYRRTFNLQAVSLADYLNDFSQNWCSYNIDNNVHEHSNSPAYGENLAWWNNNDPEITMVQVVDVLFTAWASELTYFHPGVYPDVNFNDQDTGHISQILWNTTTQIGCSLLSKDDYYFLSCNYWPPGNIYGERPF